MIIKQQNETAEYEVRLEKLNKIIKNKDYFLHKKRIERSSETLEAKSAGRGKKSIVKGKQVCTLEESTVKCKQVCTPEESTVNGKKVSKTKESKVEGKKAISTPKKIWQYKTR